MPPGIRYAPQAVAAHTVSDWAEWPQEHEGTACDPQG